HLTAKRFEGYWDKNAGPYMDGLRFRAIPDDTVSMQSLIGAETDAIDYVAPRNVASLKSNSSVAVLDVPSLAAFGFQINTTKAPFDKEAGGRGVAYAGDSAALVKGVWLGVGTPANGPISPASWAFDSSIPPIKRDLDKVKQLLAAGGKPDGFSFTMQQLNTPL